MSPLPALLSAASCLVDLPPSNASHNLKSVLLARLSQYHSRSGSCQTVSESNTLEEVEYATASEALYILGDIQQIIGVKDSPRDDGTADGAAEVVDCSTQVLIGIRDLALLRTLLSIVFKWGVDPLLIKVSLSWPSKKTAPPNIIDVTSTPADYQRLSSCVTRLMALVFPGGLQGHLLQTHITTTMLNRHTPDLLKPCITLGWAPKRLASDSTPPLDAIRPLTMRLLAILPPSQTITALGAILSSTPSPPTHVQKLCTSLLSRQLVRPDGVRGLCAAMFGEEESSENDAPLEKIEHVARVLTAVPASMKPEEYFPTVIPHTIVLLSDAVPPAYRRAAAFSVSRMLGADSAFPYQAITSATILPLLHLPFARGAGLRGTEHVLDNPVSPPSTVNYLTTAASLSTLAILITNTDPSPVFISTLLSPIAPALYSLLYHLDQVKTSDPSLKESLNGLLATWGRVVSLHEGVNVLWTVLDCEGDDWQINMEGQISRLEIPVHVPSLSLLTPEDPCQTDKTALDLEANVLNLYPDPAHFVRFLKSIDRADICSELFVKSLECYHDIKVQRHDDPMRTLLYLQLVIQMQTQLSDSRGSSNILTKPAHILSFVQHVLVSATLSSSGASDGTNHKLKEGTALRFIPDEVDDLSNGSDSDDDTPDSELVSADEEMIETAVSLLLSILEANEDLSARTSPILDDIFRLLTSIANNTSASVGSLIREASIVMTARLASTSAPHSASNKEDENDIQDIYQKALKLLQDPILPVRAHGLLLLRQLVTPQSPKHQKVDPALVPAILSIFLQSVQDDDSYIFLNAVQGLAGMVDSFGKDVLKGLIREYVKGLDELGGTDLTPRDVDTRIRIGEALGLVIRRCGDTLGVYVDMLVPPLFGLVRASYVPTTLRTSSLSLLAECESTHSLSLLHYNVDLSEAMIDLLQTESVPSSHLPTVHGQSKGEEDNQAIPTMDSHPTSTNSKFPPLRRAALHFLSLLIRETTKHFYNSASTSPPLPRALIKKARTTLAYLAYTDDDMVVRVMAREAGEGLTELGQAMMGV